MWGGIVRWSPMDDRRDRDEVSKDVGQFRRVVHYNSWFPGRGTAPKTPNRTRWLWRRVLPSEWWNKCWMLCSNAKTPTGRRTSRQLTQQQNWQTPTECLQKYAYCRLTQKQSHIPYSRACIRIGKRLGAIGDSASSSEVMRKPWRRVSPIGRLVASWRDRW